MTGVFGAVLGQILLMFLYLIIGYVLYRTGLITQEGSKALAHLLLYCVLPCVVLKSFCIEYSAKGAVELAVSIAAGAGVLLLSMAVSWLFFRKDPMAQIGVAFFQRRVHGTSAGHSSAGWRSCVLRSRLCGPAECFAVDLRPGKAFRGQKVHPTGGSAQKSTGALPAGRCDDLLAAASRCRRSFAPPWGPLRA